MIVFGSVTEAKETVFTLRMRHPSMGDPDWTAYVEGPNGSFDVGIASHPDEALLQVIDTIALHRYSEDDRHPDDPPSGR
jgi:hypothetical protein